MLNPILSNYAIDFSMDLFPDELVAKYNKFLEFKNGPIKDIKTYFEESIQSLNLPGISLSLISANGLSNRGIDMKPQFDTINRYYPGTAPMNEIIDSTQLSISMRNTLLNYMYAYESYYSYYRRDRKNSLFHINVTLMNSAEIPIIQIDFRDCFISVLPGLELSNVQTFNESKIFDIGITFNAMDIKLVTPDFNLTQITL